MQFVTYLQSHSGWRVEILPTFKDDGAPDSDYFYIHQTSPQKPPEIVKIPIAQLEALAEQLAAAVAKLKEIDARKSDDTIEKNYVTEKAHD